MISEADWQGLHQVVAWLIFTGLFLTVMGVIYVYFYGRGGE